MGSPPRERCLGTTVIEDKDKGSQTVVWTPRGVTRKVDITVGQWGTSRLGSKSVPALLTFDSEVNGLEDGFFRTILYVGDIALIADSQEELDI